jgi:hypothetical protein
MIEVAGWGLLAAIVLLGFSETVLEGAVVPRWRRRGGPNRLEDWHVRHPVVTVVGLLVGYAAIMAPVSLGQLRSLVRLHRRWHAGEFAEDVVAR